MGANEKHAATYHGGAYVPRTETVRELYGQSGNELAFDRWLSKIRAEAKAEALDEAASAYPVMLRDMVSRGSVEAWLRARANQYKENQS